MFFFFFSFLVFPILLSDYPRSFEEEWYPQWRTTTVCQREVGARPKGQPKSTDKLRYNLPRLTHFPTKRNKSNVKVVEVKVIVN